MVDPRELHRASADVELMLRMLEASKISWQQIWNRAQVPWVIVKANVPPPFGKGSDNGKGKDKAKAQGFSWQKLPRTDGPEFKNSWIKKIKQDKVEDEGEALGYPLTILQKV